MSFSKLHVLFVFLWSLILVGDGREKVTVNRKKIADSYIRSLLKKEFKSLRLKDEDITQDLIDMKRTQLEAERVLRDCKAFFAKKKEGQSKL